jgi:hypothetical protein
MRHQAADGKACLFVTMFHGPFDVQILGDQYSSTCCSRVGSGRVWLWLDAVGASMTS